MVPDRRLSRPGHEDGAGTTVVVDALAAGLGGGLTYTAGQVGGLRRARPDLDLRLLVSPANHGLLADRLPGLALDEVSVRGTLARVAWEQARLARRVPATGLLLATGNVAPLRPGSAPVVLVVQNPNAFGPGRHQPWNRSARRRARIALMRASARAATRVLAVSESMAGWVRADLPDHAERVVVVPDGAPDWTGVEPACPPGFDPDDGPWFASVAQDWPHKHLDRLVAGWGRAFGGAPAPAPRLVLVGALAAGRRAEQRALVPVALRDRLVHLGPLVDRGQVRFVLAGARASVSVSALEAHPHGPAEAGALGCPLVLSDIAPHREVAAPAPSGAITYVGVGDEGALVEALRSPPAERIPWTWPWSWEDHGRALGVLLDEALSPS